jgi:tellurite resistance protein
MKTDALKQFESVSISQIKEILKKVVPDRFDKMILVDGQPVERGYYIYSKLKYQQVERQIEQIKFPLYDSVKNTFAEFEGGVIKHGEKVPVGLNKIFDTLETNHKIESEGLLASDFNDVFKFPFDTMNDEINPQQRRYFLPDHTFQEICDECHGNKYVKCTDEVCDGRHEWDCTECHGDGRVTCEECAGDGKVPCDECGGGGMVKCGGGAGNFLARHTIGNIVGGGCGGTGYVKDSNVPGGERMCKTCRGTGEVPCPKCGRKGEIKCEKCNGRGQVNCPECDGKKTIVCQVCYGDKERYGTVDCPQCETVGTMAQIVYVDSFVSDNKYEKVSCKGDNLNLEDVQILKHVEQNPATKLVYKKVNDAIFDEYDEFSREFAKDFEKEMGLSKDDFPLVTREEVYYQVVPCVKLSYQHMIANSRHDFTIINLWKEPEIIFDSEPEELKQGLGNAAKSVGGLFGKLFKTKGFKTKEDKKNEIILLIHLAKADGKIEDQEKIVLSKMIGNLEEFTNTEKQKFFDVMNASALPELTKEDVTFSSKERAEEVINYMTELSSADGEIEPTEKALIDKIKSMI